MKLLLALTVLTLASCATTPFQAQKYVWPKDSTSPATTQTKVDLALTQTTPTTAKVTSVIIQRGHQQIQRISLPVEANINDIQLLWIDDSNFNITAQNKPLIAYQKYKTNVWYAKPIKD